MPSRFRSAVLGSSLVYPNAVVWSEENLVAVASGSTVSILNPCNPGVRGVITIPSSKPFPIGVVDGEGGDLLNGCMLPCILSWGDRPCVRSMSWSPVGLADNAGCLLAVCATGGRVKLYRFPFCDFSVEWIEVLDISELLFDYFKSTSFGDCQIVSAESLDVIPRRHNAHYESDDPPDSISRKKQKRRRQNEVIVFEKDLDNLREENTLQIVPFSFDEGKPPDKMTHDPNPPLITIQQYASRNEMLMSLAVAWSPILGISGNGVATPHNFSGYCSILAVGGKCGRISLWRIHAPVCYSIDNPRHSAKVSLIGLIKAHDTWITTINWASYGSNISIPQLLLATGSFDGRVKIWHVNSEELLKSEVIHDSFSLLKEVTTVDSARISVLSLTVPSQSPWKLFLAIGKGSGSFEVWIIDMLTKKFNKVGCYNAHNLIVTGLAWAFDGRCLYSCGQDKSMKSWILVENSLYEVPVPSDCPGLKCSAEVHHVVDSCFGLAVSPGNMAIAVARGFDINLLNPMYQGRSHRAAVEFLWIGGQRLDLSSAPCQEIYNKSFPGFPEEVWWEINILWSLNQYVNLNKIVNIWDIVAALLAFKHSASGFVDNILLKWLTSYLRHVMLKAYKEDNTSSKEQDLEGLGVTKDDQMEQWVSQNVETVKDHTKFLAAEVGKVEKRILEDLIGYEMDERCSFCSAVVPFESIENAICSGVNYDNGVRWRHKLKRCANTMRILPTKPSWYCACCHRQAIKLAPSVLFAMLEYPTDFKSLLDSSAYNNSSTPCCPFCGILLQRLQPEYSLSASPV